MGPNILVTGSIAVDYILNIPGKFRECMQTSGDKIGLAVMANARSMRFGGTAGNISYNLGLLEVPHYVMSRVGKDFADLGYAKHFESPNRHMAIDHIPNDYTASCYILNDESANQISAFYEGALGHKLDVLIHQKIKNASEINFAINAPQNPGAMKNIAQQLNELKVKMIFDPGQVTPAFSKADMEPILSKAYALISNEFEFNIISKTLGRNRKEILELVPQIITTQGGKGSLLSTKNGEMTIPVAIPRDVKDTTGAGDGYRAGLLAGLFNKFPLEQCCQLGAVIGSFVVETVGAQTQVFSRKEVETRFKTAFGKQIKIN
jgi:adenosine kinase